MKRESNEGGRIPRTFFARSPGGSTVMFRCYLLRGDTVAPSGLYGRLCHAFLVSINFIANARMIFELFCPYTNV